MAAATQRVSTTLQLMKPKHGDDSEMSLAETTTVHSREALNWANTLLSGSIPGVSMANLNSFEIILALGFLGVQKGWGIRLRILKVQVVLV